MNRPSSRLLSTSRHQSWQFDSPTTCALLCSLIISVAASQYSCSIPFTPSRISPRYSRPSYAWLPRAPFSCTPRQILNANCPVPHPFPSTCHAKWRRNFEIDRSVCGAGAGQGMCTHLVDRSQGLLVRLVRDEQRPMFGTQRALCTVPNHPEVVGHAGLCAC